MKKLEVILYLLTQASDMMPAHPPTPPFWAFLKDEECLVPTFKRTMDMNSRLNRFCFFFFP